MMATTVEGMNADTTRGPHFDSTTDTSPLLQASYQALQRDYWASLASSRQRLAFPPATRVEIASTPSLPPATPPPAEETKQSASPKDTQSTLEGGSTRKRERPAVSSPPSHSNQISPHLLHALQLAKEEPSDDGEEEGRAVRNNSSSRETNGKTTTLDVENKAIFTFWSQLMERFGGRQANKDGSVCPEAVLLEIMEVISFYASNEISMQDAFTKLAALFRRNKCIDLYEDLVGLLLQQNVRKEFLIKKGIDIAFLSKKTKPEDEDMEQEEIEDSDGEAEEDEDDDEEEEEEEEEEELDKRPTKRTRRASKQPTTRKRKASEATYTPKKAKPQQEESGRLRRSPDKWTPEEDDKLIALVEKHGTGTKKWRQIAEELGTTKNSSKCAQHWRRVLAPNIHKGSWTAEEEEKLLLGVEKYGLTQWTLVAKEIPGRTDIQCRYHYMRQQNSRACSWTGEEEKLLEGLVAKHGSDDVKCWVYISDELAESKIRRTPRTALECQQHWAVIKKREGAKKLKKQK